MTRPGTRQLTYARVNAAPKSLTILLLPILPRHHGVLIRADWERICHRRLRHNGREINRENEIRRGQNEDVGTASCYDILRRAW